MKNKCEQTKTKDRIKDHPLMMSHKFGDCLIPLLLCHTKLPVLLSPLYIVSQKCEPPTPYSRDFIYEQPLLDSDFNALDLT